MGYPPNNKSKEILPVPGSALTLTMYLSEEWSLSYKHFCVFALSVHAASVCPSSAVYSYRRTAVVAAPPWWRPCLVGPTVTVC